VRLAYLLAAARGRVAGESVAQVTSVAALVRDRELAAADLRDLLADASRSHGDVMHLLTERRASHRFRVEAPPMAPLTPALRVEAMNAAPALVRALDTLDRVTAAPPRGAAAPVLWPAFAERLWALGAERPSLAEVVVPLHGYQKESFHASNEEMLTALSVVLASGSAAAGADSSRRSMALAVLSSAVALRTLAQSAPWFPGDDGPDVTDLTSEFGLADVSFSRAVPAAWQPYYLRELRDGLRDMEEVLPGLKVRGLRVQFSADEMRDSALAMHNPRTRALELSVMTSAGTLAHELAHDLDWQAARRLYYGGAGYSTDRAMREQRGPLASSVRGLADARPLRAVGSPMPMGDRPAELFARGADWFVASALAARGRTNGFLTAVQDAALSGYAAGPPTAVGSAGATALMSAIEQITYLPDSRRDAFAIQWADPDMVDPLLLVRRVLETPIGGGTVERWNGGMPAQRNEVGVPSTFRSSVLPFHRSTNLPPAVCVADPSPETLARERLLLAAADARARGWALRRARYRPPGMRPAWANSVLGAPPSSTDEGEQMVDALRVGIIAGLTTALPGQGVLPLVPAIFRSSASSCASISR
jgi:hypothetical protein